MTKGSVTSELPAPRHAAGLPAVGSGPSSVVLTLLKTEGTTLLMGIMMINPKMALALGLCLGHRMLSWP